MKAKLVIVTGPNLRPAGLDSGRFGGLGELFNGKGYDQNGVLCRERD